jgi:hypothetical protein
MPAPAGPLSKNLPVAKAMRPAIYHSEWRDHVRPIEYQRALMVLANALIGA